MNPRSSQARYDFTGRVAVVTGAAGGIGRAICDAFSDNGASAVNWDRIAGKEGTAKAGVIAMTKSLGKELAQTGILVNGIAPAAVETPLLRQMAGHTCRP
jgi:3-oxoacyl-[acyl-carrier protein] reductase